MEYDPKYYEKLNLLNVPKDRQKAVLKLIMKTSKILGCSFGYTFNKMFRCLIRNGD